MNMLGIIAPIESDLDRHRSPVQRVRDWAVRSRAFLLLVVLPALLVAGYLFVIASDQYESEAHFLVRSTDVQTMPGTGIGSALSLVAGASGAQSEAMSVADYLTSHDVVDTLRRDDRLVERFHRPEADLFSRLRTGTPTPEKLLTYYRDQVKVHFNSETGITTLQVHSFTPQDSYELARRLMDLGEKRVNILNTRSYNDSIANARRQLAQAEADLAQVQVRLTQFRQRRADIDPQASGQAQIGLVSGLNTQLAVARAQLAAMGNAISRSSPQYQALSARVAALSGQVAAQSGRLAGGGRAIANDISGFEALQLRQQFLGKRYEAAAASLDKARDQAIRQQLYLVRVVDANMPVKALYPERWRILATVVVALLLAYSIGWLIVAGVREHAA